MVPAGWTFRRRALDASELPAGVPFTHVNRRRRCSTRLIDLANKRLPRRHHRVPAEEGEDAWPAHEAPLLAISMAARRRSG